MVRQNEIDALGFYHTCSVLVDAEFAAAGSTYNHDDALVQYTVLCADAF